MFDHISRAASGPRGSRWPRCSASHRRCAPSPARHGGAGHLGHGGRTARHRVAPDPDDLSAFSAASVPVLRCACSAGCRRRCRRRCPTPRSAADWMKVKANLGAGYRETQRSCATAGSTRCARRPAAQHLRVLGGPHRHVHDPGERCTRRAGSAWWIRARTARSGGARAAGRGGCPAGFARTVVTSVARDDLDDGGSGFVATIKRCGAARRPPSKCSSRLQGRAGGARRSSRGRTC